MLMNLTLNTQAGSVNVTTLTCFGELAVLVLHSIGVINMLAFWMPSVPAAEVRHVQYESNITLGCNISYLYHTTWLKHNPHLTPTVVLCASLRDGEATQGSA